MRPAEAAWTWCSSARRRPGHSSSSAISIPRKPASWSCSTAEAPRQPSRYLHDGGRRWHSALSRDLGPVDYPGAPGVLVEATYTTAEYVAQSLGGATAVAALAPDRHVAFLVTERTHTANLPADADPPDLYVNGSRRALVDRHIMTDSPHHRATVYRYTRDDTFGTGHQMVTLRLAGGPEATWHLPLVIPDIANAAAGPVGLGEQWGLILALLGGMLAAMWPCLFQLTVYFIPALAGVAMQDAGGEAWAAVVRCLWRLFSSSSGSPLCTPRPERSSG